MLDTIAVILGGGRGTRLFPLTHERSKPAVPLAGKYRLIDIPISNCLNSNLRRIFVLTQYNSESLNKHVALTYKFDIFTSGFVTKSLTNAAAAEAHLTLTWYLLVAASAGVFLHAGIKFPWFVFFHRDQGLRPRALCRQEGFRVVQIRYCSTTTIRLFG